jgi:cytidine deaminase
MSDPEIKTHPEPIDDHALVMSAVSAQNQAYVPYSKFPVGAALIDENGRLFTGCNIENASFSATCCAERTAIFKAISNGSRRIKRMAVVCDQAGFCMPCGTCRQVMAEFASDDFVLLAAKPNGQYRCYTMDQLLPDRFALNSTPGSQK